MPPASQRILIAYFFMVMLPIISFVGVLKRGRTISAPSSVGGTWKLELGTGKLDGFPCWTPIFSHATTSLVISQSGAVLTLEIRGGANINGIGSIQANTLNASFLLTSEMTHQQYCSSGRVLRLKAIVDSTDELKNLTGTLSEEECSFCGSMKFHAVRQVATIPGAL